MSKIIDKEITDLNVEWNGYSGKRVEDFIKKELSKSCGYIYRSANKEGDYYYLYGFQSIEDYYKWLDGETITPLFKVQLPNIENDVYSVSIATNSNTKKLVNLGAGVKINVRYTSISTNPTTGAITDTYNDGTLIITRSANGSAYQEVGRILISPFEHSKEGYTEIDITKYLADGDNKLRIRVEDNVNGSISNNINFESVINTTLKIANATDASKPLRALNLQYYIEGQIAKTLNIKVTANSVESVYALPLGDTTYIEVPYTANIEGTFNTGVIDVESWLSVDETVLESDHIYNQFYFIAEQSDDSIVILNNVVTNVTNYANTRFFDFSIYNSPSDVHIVITNDAETILEYTFSNCEIEKVYSFYNTLEIESTSKLINALVTVSTKDMQKQYAITVDNSEDMNPTSGADFILNPKLRSNSDANRNIIINEATHNTVSATFTNFKFKNDGWVNDESGVGVLRIPAGEQLTINYDPFDNLTNGTTVEFDFKTYNVFGSEPLFTMASYIDDKLLGFELTSSEAVFMTLEKQMKRDQDIMFQEDERTHVAINIIPNLSGSGLNYIRIFVNGIMNREMIYTKTDIFKSGAVNLVFGSDNTDIDIYGLRIYKKGLSANNIRQDYMSSLPTIEEKIAFKTANDIVSANGTISYDKASVKYNTLVWTGKHPEYITGKVKFKGNLSINIIGDKEHSGSINNMTISGQGSSSRGYWKWNHQYVFNDNSVWVNGNGEEMGAFYQLQDGDPLAKILVAKLNWASSMQSHKIGSTALFNDLWKAVVGGNSITRTSGYEDVRVAIHEKPFLYFIKETEASTPAFAGLMTFGQAKGDAPTFGYDETVFPNYLMLEGSDNGMPLTLRQMPWTDDVTYNEDEEFYELNGEGQLDFVLGNNDKFTYFKDAFNFTYLNSNRLSGYTEDSEMVDKTYQYMNLNTGNIKRWDAISGSWVDAGTNRIQECLFHYDEEGVKIIDQMPVYSVLNAFEGVGEQTVEQVIERRINTFKTGISSYYNVSDVLFCMAFLKLVAASDNRCKNTYEYLDPVTLKICMAQDDLDTIILSDNVGRKVKPYYVEEHDMNGTSYYWNGEDNVFYNLMESAFGTELRAMLKSILDTMNSSEFGGSAEECLNRYYFSVQKYFPAVAYNETARLLYEEASVAQDAGIYQNGTPAISQSLGDQLQAEKQWWKKRLKYMQSLASSAPFYVRSNGSLGFRSLLTTESERPTYQFNLTPYQWLYPKVGVGQSMGSDNTRVQAGNIYRTTTIETDGNTDTFIYGVNYYTSLGEFGDKSIGEAFELSGDKLLEFSADSRKVESYQFRPTSMRVNCPVMKKFVLYGCSTLSGSLDLKNNKKLEEVDLRNTGLSTVLLPETETLNKVYVSGLSSIYMIGCNNLNDFYMDNYSSLNSVTTDSNILLDNVLTYATNISEVHLQNINADYSSDSNKSEVLFNILVAERSSASGVIRLNKELTSAEKKQLFDKYGTIDNPENALYVTYTLHSVNYAEISGDERIAKGATKEYTVSYEGNDAYGYEWMVENCESFTPSGNTVRIKAPYDNTNNISVICVIKRVNGDDFTVQRYLTVYEPVQMTGIELDVAEVDETGLYVVPIYVIPSNYTNDIADVRATITANDCAEIQSQSIEGVTLDVHSSVSTVVKTATINVIVEDDLGQTFTASNTVYFTNPIKMFLVDGQQIGI